MFTFPVDPAPLFEERARQFEGWGIPSSIVADVRARVRDMWSDEPYGWVPAWAAHAERAEREGKWLGAALLWGAARFPCLATRTKKAAYARQLAAYQQASAGFPVSFERMVIDVTAAEGATPVAVHVFRRRLRPGRALVVLLGGADTWKVELHRFAVTIARATGTIVAAVDLPGTGESRVPLSPSSDQLIGATIDQLAGRYRAERTALVGISFGGHWAAKLALTDRVDAAIDLGGPVGAGEAPLDLTALPNGISGTVAHALRLPSMPTHDRAVEAFDEFSLRRQGLLDHPSRTPLLVVNGEHDPYLPLIDSTVFASHPTATVWVVRGATHCAAEHIRRVVPAAMGWLSARLHEDSPAYRVVESGLRVPLRPLLAGVSSP